MGVQGRRVRVRLGHAVGWSLAAAVATAGRLPGLQPPAMSLTRIEEAGA